MTETTRRATAASALLALVAFAVGCETVAATVRDLQQTSAVEQRRAVQQQQIEEAQRADGEAVARAQAHLVEQRRETAAAVTAHAAAEQATRTAVTKLADPADPDAVPAALEAMGVQVAASAAEAEHLRQVDVRAQAVAEQLAAVQARAPATAQVLADARRDAREASTINQAILARWESVQSALQFGSGMLGALGVQIPGMPALARQRPPPAVAVAQPVAAQPAPAPATAQPASASAAPTSATATAGTSATAATSSSDTAGTAGAVTGGTALAVLLAVAVAKWRQYAVGALKDAVLDHVADRIDPVAAVDRQVARRRAKRPSPAGATASNGKGHAGSNGNGHTETLSTDDDDDAMEPAGASNASISRAGLPLPKK